MTTHPPIRDAALDWAMAPRAPDFADWDGFTAWLDINPEGVSKASALELVRRKLAIEPSNTVAVGDQRNDLEMLRWAARGVAMGGAPPEVVAAADETTGSVDDDGLADALRPLY